MRASELRPGQFFEPIGTNVNGRCLWIGTDDDGMLWAFKHNGRLRHCWTDEDFEVTPLNVHGWDDEPQREPLPMKPTPAMQRISEVMGEHQSPQDSPVKPAPLQLREGARFLMRQQGETGPVHKVDQEDYVWSGGTHSWTAEGRYWASGWDSPYDLIAEVPPPVEPVIKQSLNTEPEQFKAGDWVVCVDDNGCSGIHKGDVLLVSDIDEDGDLGFDLPRGKFFYLRCRFRRATPAEVAEARYKSWSPFAPVTDIDGEPLKVGDRVTCVACETRSDCRAHFDGGCEYEVTAIDEGWIAVGGNDDNQPGWCPLYFRKVKTPPLPHWTDTPDAYGNPLLSDEVPEPFKEVAAYKQAQEPPFQVGEKVRCISQAPNLQGCVGVLYTVHDYSTNGIRLREAPAAGWVGYEHFARDVQEPEPDADGWIEHDGKGCPVARSQRVMIRVYGFPEDSYGPYLASDVDWEDLDRPTLKITHYRLVQPAPHPIAASIVNSIDRFALVLSACGVEVVTR